MIHGDNIVLIGMPGAGKSTVGVLLSKQTNRDFLDTDLLIQNGEGCFLYELIQSMGVQSFLDIEARYIQNIAQSRTVIATGGSVIYRAAAMAHLQSLGTIVFLDTTLAAVIRRLNDLDERGVVRLPGQSIESICSERRQLYLRYGQIVIDTSDLTPEQVVRAIRSALN
jgi:shikimate kinase